MIMKFPFLYILLTASTGLLLAACGSQPRVIEGQSNEVTATPNSIPSLENSSAPKEAASTEVRKIRVDEVLETERYNYLRVSEAGQSFWIAISRIDPKPGDILYFRGGLLKKDFYSQEFNRVFDAIYLVSEIWGESDPGVVGLAEVQVSVDESNSLPNLEIADIKPAPGAITLAALFAQKEKYNSQTVRVTGKCVKVNPMIMNRNWIHLVDGSGKDLDLAITTLDNIPLGAVVTMEGIIALDKDFGAGYRYDIILEGAVRVQ
jgi:hypothetical protein